MFGIGTPEFKCKCPSCGQTWSKLMPDGRCFDCNNGKAVKVVLVKPEQPKLRIITPDPIVGLNDAIEPYEPPVTKERKDIYG
jgi:hypothetical protein